MPPHAPPSRPSQRAEDKEWLYPLQLDAAPEQSTGGSHSVSYNAVDAPWVVSGAGYRGTEPEMLAPQVKLLELYRHGEEDCDDAEELLQLAFSSRKEEWASLRDRDLGRGRSRFVDMQRAFVSE